MFSAKHEQPASTVSRSIHKYFFLKNVPANPDDLFCLFNTFQKAITKQVSQVVYFIIRVYYTETIQIVLLSIFVLFSSSQFKYKLKKEQMLCLGFEPMVNGWQLQTDPLSYGGRPFKYIFRKKFKSSFLKFRPSRHFYIYFGSFSNKQFSQRIGQGETNIH